MNPHDTQRPTPRSGDPDATAELPVLGAIDAGDADGWSPPPPVRGTLVDEVLQAHENEIHLLRRELALAARQRATFERQYLEAVETGEEYRLQLSAAEARADELARQLNELERGLEERDVRIGELQLDLDDVSAATAAGLAAAPAGAPAAAAAVAAPAPAAAAAAAPVRAADEALLRGVYAELEQLRWRVAAQAEALQTRETRRSLAAADWHELEGRLAEREAQVEALGRELAAARLAVAATPVPVPAPVQVAQAAHAAGSVHATDGAVAGDAAVARAAALPDAAADAKTGAAQPATQAGPGAEAPEPPAATPAAVPEAAAGPTPQDATATAARAEPAGSRSADTGAFAATGDFSSTGTYSGRGRERAAADGDGLVRLLVRQDGESQQPFELGRRTTIGRTPDNDLRIPADWVSRHHAVLLQTAAGTVIEDLNSTNGVTVNGLRVARRQLADGDYIAFGKTVFRFEMRPAGQSPVPAARPRG